MLFSEMWKSNSPLLSTQSSILKQLKQNYRFCSCGKANMNHFWYTMSCISYDVCKTISLKIKEIPLKHHNEFRKRYYLCMIEVQSKLSNTLLLCCHKFSWCLLVSSWYQCHELIHSDRSVHGTIYNWINFNHGSWIRLQLPVCKVNFFGSIKIIFCIFWIQENASSSKQTVHNVSEKKVSLRAVRQFMRLGKSKQQSSRRDSSTEDEGR